MKYFIATLVVFFLFSANAYADQRCDMDTDNCHLSLDPNDDDTEVDVPASTLSSVGVSRSVVDGVRVADCWYTGTLRYPLDKGFASTYLVEGADIYRQGKDANIADANYIVAANTACNCTRSNYQENTGSDDQNQTEYTTNDWELRLQWYNKYFDTRLGQLMGMWTVAMSCRAGTAN